MQIDLIDTTARIAGAETALAAALRTRLAESGARLVTEGVADLLVLSAPLENDPGFDWNALSDLARTCAAAMQARGKGRILFLLAASAALPVRREPEMSMRMASLQAMMRGLAMSLAPEVAVNAMGAGAIGDDNGQLVSGDAAMIGHASVGRAGTVEEACNVALFLCDPDNTYLTGQLLLADGGWSAGYGRSF